MADGSAIEWTDATWNPIVGCSVVSPGCTNCYAMRVAGARTAHTAKYQGLTKPSKAGPVWTGDVRLWERALTEPLRWREPRKVFVNSMGDLFHPAVPAEWIDRVFAVMALAPQHVFQILTKRPENMRAYVLDALGRVADRVEAARSDRSAVGPLPHLAPGDQWWPLPNVWLGTSVEDQPRADERIPILLDTPAAVRWISAEPLIGAVDITRLRVGVVKHMPFPGRLDATRGILFPSDGLSDLGVEPVIGPRLNWVVAGGESGPDARPMQIEWAESLRDQCRAAGAAFFMKQMARKAPIPEHLLIREMPNVR